MIMALVNNIEILQYTYDRVELDDCALVVSFARLFTFSERNISWFDITRSHFYGQLVAPGLF